MSRDYGRVATAFWSSPSIRGLDDKGKLLANYLLSGPHSNACGAYLLPDAYIGDDLNWPIETVRETLSKLFQIGFATRFKDGRHIVICKFLDWNPVENPNVGKAILKQVDQLPDDPALSFIYNGLKQYSKQFPNGFETVRERFENCSETDAKTVSEHRTEPNRTEPITEPKVPIAIAPGRNGAADVLDSKPAWWPRRDRYGRVVSEFTDKTIYEVGRAVLGEKSGGLVTKARKAMRRDQAVLELLLQADEKSDGKSWFASAVRAAEMDEPVLFPSEVYPANEYRA